jgi:UDP-N-acetylglucosamine 2-epimerase (non-hydrolysing)
VKIVTVLGTRPEIIRLSVLIAKLDQACDHVLVNTGQNFHKRLSDVFFEELGVRRPDYDLEVRGSSMADQVARILTGCEEVFLQEKPDRLLILGDTNSSLCAYVAKRLAIPVFHMEAGNRCYDDRVPEEVNRRVIDQCSDVLMPYTERSRQNLMAEGFASNRVYAIGNPIFEVLEHFGPQIEASRVLSELDLQPGGYFLVTMHRAENVDLAGRLADLAASLVRLNAEHQVPVVVSTHPRTRARMAEYGVEASGADVRFPEPFGLFDFITLEKNARCVLSDSGTVQEECALFGVPNVTLRDVTERPETIECGSNLLSGADPEVIVNSVKTVLSLKPRWQAPPEYLAPAVSDTVLRIVLGYHAHLEQPPTS